jgi:8-oxo-dGTP pyrophosphatase MutT (NUDIX family)
MAADNSKIIDVAAVRRSLAGTRMPGDPTKPVMPADAERWPAAFLQRAQQGLRAAGVLVPLIDRDEGLTVLLTQRSSELRLHAGQVSFPGGRMEDADKDIQATALREAHEEVGIPEDLVEIAGFLNTSPTVTGYAVTPVVGLVRSDVIITIDPGEVEAAFEVPLEFLLDERNQGHSTREFEGVMLNITEFNYAGRRIWGATATMLLQLRKYLIKQ